jgi:oligopeptide/dipeptide ABC transporter ATP-binding protein
MPFPQFRVSNFEFRFYHSSVPLLAVHNLTVELPTPSGWIRPVAGVSFSLDAGATLGVVGESGSGKTMLALALLGLLPPGARLSGSAEYRVSNIESPSANNTLDLVTLPENQLRRLRGSALSMIFQEPMTALNPVLRIGAQIEEAIAVHNPALPKNEIRRRALAALEQAAVSEPAVRAAQFPHQLSGGLRQRALIAMALACGPRLLIADEPTTALDVTIQKQILDLLKDLRAQLGLALLFITHDLAVVSQVAENIAVMYAGRIVEEGPTGEILRRPRHPYTEGLLRAAPSLEKKTLQPIPGSVPQLDALPPGCAFEPRCPLRRPECSLAVPDLRVISSTHRARCVLIESENRK